MTQVTVHTYIITHPSNNLSMVCPNSTMGLDTNVPGALEVSVPRGYRSLLTHRDDIFIMQDFPWFACGRFPETIFLYTLWKT